MYRPGSTVDMFRIVAKIALFSPEQSLSAVCSALEKPSETFCLNLKFKTNILRPAHLVMRETSKGAVEKAEAVVLIGQKVLVKS